MKAYRLFLREQRGDKFTIRFDCWAEDEDHAEEQAIDAYNCAFIVSCVEIPSSDYMENGI